jgi:hypothetical protein
MWGGVAATVHAIKVQTFRYFRFLPNGVVLYCLTHAQPQAVAPRLCRPPTQAQLKDQASQRTRHLVVDSHNNQKPEVVVGTYSLHRDQVMVRVKSHYNVVNFQLKLTHGKRGHFCRLEIAHHHSRPLAAPLSAAPTYHSETKGYTFRFLRAFPHLT